MTYTNIKNIGVECPKVIMECLENPVIHKKCSAGRWFLSMEKVKGNRTIKFLYSRPETLVGILIKAEIKNENIGGPFLVKEISVDALIEKVEFYNKDISGKTVEEIAIDVIRDCFNEIEKDLQRQH